MEPAQNTVEYHKQVEQICAALQNLEEKDLAQGLSLYIFDKNFSRLAIIEAEKRLKH